MTPRFKVQISLSIILLLTGQFSPAEAAPTSCKKVNEIKTIQNKENACTKVAGKLIWKPSNVRISEIVLTDALPIPDGFSIQIRNFNSDLSWFVSAPSGDATVDDFGLITVTGNLLPSDMLQVKASKGKFYRITTYKGPLFELKNLEQPIFASTMTLNSDGIRVSILNYDPERYWEVTSSVGDAYIDNEGFLEVSGIEAAGNININIKIGADGYKSIQKNYSYALPEAVPTPSLSAISNQTSNSFEFSIQNYDAKFKWTAAATAGAAVISDRGVVRVNGLLSNQSSSITITASKDGMRSATSEQSGTSLAIYANLSEREWALIAKDPIGNSGKLIIVYGYITQFDAATGLNQFRADVSGINARNNYGFTGDNTFVSGDANMLKNFVAKDYFTAKVIVRGSKTYTTTLNGSITVPQLEIVEISRL
jgi:hypothetical protein